jgi:hypothetical protein
MCTTRSHDFPFEIFIKPSESHSFFSMTGARNSIDFVADIIVADEPV